MENIAINQDLTKTRNKLAYDARKLVRAVRAKFGILILLIRKYVLKQCNEGFDSII